MMRHRRTALVVAAFLFAGMAVPPASAEELTIDGKDFSAVEGGISSSYVYDRTGRRMTMAQGASRTHFPSEGYTATASSSAVLSRERRVQVDGLLLGTSVAYGPSSATSTAHLVHADHLGGTSTVTDWYGGSPKSWTTSVNR